MQALAASTAGFRRQQLRHVGLRAARLALVEQPAGLEAHEVRRLDLDEAFGDGELHALVLADRAAEHLPLFRIGRHAVDEPVAVADAFRRDQDALGVEPIEDVAEALTLLADEVLGGNLEIVEEELVGLVVDHVEDGPDGHAAAIAALMSTRKIERPSDFFFTSASGVVRASRIIKSECCTRLIQTFWPLMT